MNNKIAILFLCAGALLAQDGPEKATVPLKDPSRPARIEARLMAGGITVRGADVKEVLVEAHSRGERGDRESRGRHADRADGMKRLDLPGNAGLDVTEEDNVVTIKTSSMNRPADLVITVPRRSSLRLKCMNDGDIHVEQVDGEIDANNLNGRITLKNVAGSVVAHSLNGAVFATLDRIDSGKPMSFSTLNGDIDVTLPDSLKANVRMKTDNGEIYSDFEVKLMAGASVEGNNSGRQADGSFHLRFDHALRGTINGGGPEFQFTSFNGQIYIRKKK
jgi:hypothetical protein